MHCSLYLFPISLFDKVFQWLFQINFFSFGRQKKVVAGRVKQVVVLFSNDCTGIRRGILSALVVLDEWWSYRGGRLNRFVCNALKVVSATFALVCFLSLRKALVKLAKMLFISLRKLFSFSRKLNFRILDFQIHDFIECLSIKQEIHFTK